MTSAVVLAAYDTTTTSTPQMIFGGLVMMAAVLVAVYFKYQAPYAGMEHTQKKLRDYVRGRLEESGFRAAYVYSDEDRGDWRDRIQQLGDNEYNPPSSVLGAIAEGQRIASTRFDSARLDRVPTLVYRVGGETVLYLVLGLIAVTPVAVVQNAMRGASSVTSPDTSILDTFAQLGGELMAAYPYGEMVSALTLAFGVKFVEFVYGSPLVVGFLTTAFVVAVAYLYTQIEEDEVPRGVVPGRLNVLKATAALFLATWGVGVLVNAPFRALDVAGVGNLVGFLASGLVFLAGLVLATRELVGYMQDAYAGDSDTRAVTAYVVSSYTLVVLGALLVPFILAFAFVALADGKLAAFVGLFINETSAPIKVGVGAVFVALSLLAGTVFQSALTVLKDALARAMVLRTVRLRLFALGVPVVAMVFTFIIVTAVGLGPYVGVVAALVAGVLLRCLYSLVSRFRYRFTARRQYTRLPSRLLVEFTQVELPADHEHDVLYVARLDGDHRLAHTNRAALFEQLLADVQAMFDDGETNPSVANRVYRDAFEHGVVDPDASRSKLQKRAREYVLGNLRNNGGSLSKDEVRDKVTEKVPEDLYEQEIARYRRQGMIDETPNTYRLLKHDVKTGGLPSLSNLKFWG